MVRVRDEQDSHDKRHILFQKARLTSSPRIRLSRSLMARLAGESELNFDLEDEFTREAKASDSVPWSLGLPEGERWGSTI